MIVLGVVAVVVVVEAVMVDVDRGRGASVRIETCRRRKAKLVSDVMSGLFCFGCCGRGKSSLPSLLTGAAEFYCFGSCFIACSV